MKRIFSLILAAVLALCLSLSCFAADNETVTLDLNKTYQTMDGFGASYTWYLGWAVQHNQKETIWDWVFNETEFNILRFRDLNNVRNDDEAKFPGDGYPEYWDVYSAAIKRGITPTVLVTSWGEYRRDLDWVAYSETPSGWTYYTLAKDKDGNYMYDALAQHCVKSVQYFFDAGIPVDYFSISNEIELQERHTDENGKARDEAGFFFGQQEDEYHCAYWKAHIAVYEAFKEAFGENAPKILGAETMAAYPDLMKGYIDPVAENCPESLETVGHHLYGTDLSEKNLTAVGEAMKDYKIWQTEWYNNNFFEQAEVMMDCIVYENLSAYLYWNGVWASDLSNCIIEVGADPNSDICRWGNHYMMMYFSKFIKQGYKRIDVADELKTKIAAFKSPDDGKIVVVAMNRSDLTEFMTLDFPGKEGYTESQVWLSTEGESRFRHKYMEDMGAYQDQLEIPSRTVMTVVLQKPDFVEPVVEKKVNPLVKERSLEPDGELPFNVMAVVVGVVVLVVIILAVVAGVVISNTKKLAKKDAEDKKE